MQLPRVDVGFMAGQADHSLPRRINFSVHRMTLPFDTLNGCHSSSRVMLRLQQRAHFTGLLPESLGFFARRGLKPR